jgi:hypothetical protein
VAHGLELLSVELDSLILFELGESELDDDGDDPCESRRFSDTPIPILGGKGLKLLEEWYLPLISNSPGSCQHGDVIAARGFNDTRWPGK